MAERVLKRRSVVLFISDFVGLPDLTRFVGVPGRRHDVIPVWLTDPMEERLPDVGFLWVRDPETGEERMLDTSSKHVRDAYARTVRGEQLRVSEIFRRSGMSPIRITNGQDWRAAAAAVFPRTSKATMIALMLVLAAVPRHSVKKPAALVPALKAPSIAPPIVAAQPASQPTAPVAPLAAKGPVMSPTITATLEPQVAEVGDPLLYVLKIEHAQADEVQLPQEIDWGGLELLDRSRTSSAKGPVVTEELHFKLASYEVGEHTVPAIGLVIAGVPFTTIEQKITTQSVMDKDAQANAKLDAKGPAVPPQAGQAASQPAQARKERWPAAIDRRDPILAACCARRRVARCGRVSLVEAPPSAPADRGRARDAYPGAPSGVAVAQDAAPKRLSALWKFPRLLLRSERNRARLLEPTLRDQRARPRHHA